MKLIKPDPDRSLRLPGVPDPVLRPVDIDQAQTGFASLRSLRIYRFRAGSVIEGHAEDDEVLIVVLAGSLQLTLSEHELAEGSPQFTLSAVGKAKGDPCVAYLPPNGAYRLVPQTEVEVAYARATPTSGRAPAVFFAKPLSDVSGDVILFEEAAYPQHLRLRVVDLRATEQNSTMLPVQPSEAGCEALVHVRTSSTDGAISLTAEGAEPLSLDSWDTVAVKPAERAVLHLTANSAASLLVVLACT